jgi:zinc D-Ala-D-Ala carboxypeptidase
MENNISKHVTLKELTKNNTASKLGLDNTPTEEHYNNLKNVVLNVFEPLREAMGNNPIFISSAYRSKAVNKATKGASLTSYHAQGKALDLDADVFGKMTNSQIFHYIKDNMEYAELIWEYGNSTNPDWVHVAFDEGKNVKETLRCTSVNGKPHYEIYK